MTFHVTLRPSGHTFDVKEGQSILAAGFALPYSCRTGVCNTCKGRVTKGEVDQAEVLPSHLSLAARAEGHALLCTAKAKSDLEIEVAELEGEHAMPPKIYPARLAKIERAAPDVALLSLRMPPNENMRYRAGQYVEIITKTGQRRAYSLAAPPKPEGLVYVELHIRHVPGGHFTDHLFGAAQERDLLKLEGPFGTFFLRDGEKPIVLLAGGTGFAPIKAIAEQALKQGDTRSMTLYWGGRRRVDLYLLSLAEDLARNHPTFSFVPVLSEPSDACAWAGRTGQVHEAVLADLPDLAGHQVYAAGSPAMIDAARAAFAKHGLPDAEFFSDSFLTAKERAGAP